MASVQIVCLLFSWELQKETGVNCIKKIPIIVNTYEWVYKCVAILMETTTNYLLAHKMKAYLGFLM